MAPTSGPIERRTEKFSKNDELSVIIGWFQTNKVLNQPLSENSFVKTLENSGQGEMYHRSKCITD